jgi:2-oxoglutarate ferredoxin oxidoreductase subunit alpha
MFHRRTQKEGKQMLKATSSTNTQELDRVTILFGGDSGDGMQLTGTQFTATSALFGNDVSTFPDYPSEIRAPAGSLAGVSAYQLSFSSTAIHTPGDQPDVLVVMNPAALRVYLSNLKPSGILIANRDAFHKANLKKAGYRENPLEDPELVGRYRLHAVPITTLTVNALEDLDLSKKEKERCKNFFALGLAYWLYGRPLEPSLSWIDKKFSAAAGVAQANRRALEAGYHYGETEEAFAVNYIVKKAPSEPGTYRIVNGNEASALGFATAARLADKPLVYSSYPITPATDVLQELAKLKHLDVRTIQYEDEIAAMGSTIGAAFGGTFALTGTSGPGVCLKSEAVNLAIMMELPLVILNVQRGGPSTGMPTKTEQSDLLQAAFGRNGESPIPILAAASPADCFNVAIEAFRIAVRHTTPVFMLTDGYIANGAEPWRIPKFEDLEPIEVRHPTDPANFLPYSRDETTLARPWAIPGTAGLEHRLGGLEKQDRTGLVSYNPENHDRMCRLRAEKVRRIADFIPEVLPEGPGEGDLLVLSWGGTFGSVYGAVHRAQQKGRLVAHVHLRHVNPFPKNLGEILARYKKVLVPELNLGQLALLIRGTYPIIPVSYTKLKGRPFTISEVEEKIEEVL